MIMRHLRHLLPLLTLALGLLSPSLKAQDTAEKKTPPTHPLTLTVDGIIEPKGELLIAIYSSAESYPQNPYKTAMAKVDSLRRSSLTSPKAPMVSVFSKTSMGIRPLTSMAISPLRSMASAIMHLLTMVSRASRIFSSPSRLEISSI